MQSSQMFHQCSEDSAHVEANGSNVCRVLRLHVGAIGLALEPLLRRRPPLLDHDHRLPVQGRGFRLQVEGVRVSGLRFRVQSLGFRVQGPGLGVQGSGFRVQGVGFRVQGSGSRV